MAWLDGKLYAALAGGYLVRCGLNGGACETLASSRRETAVSPFDDAPPFSVPYLAADAKRHRLLFFAATPARPETNGLWSYDPARKAFQRLLKITIGSRSSGGPIGGSPSGTTKILLWFMSNWALRLDLTTDALSLLYRRQSAERSRPDGCPSRSLRLSSGAQFRPLRRNRRLPVVGGWLRPHVEANQDHGDFPGRAARRCITPDACIWSQSTTARAFSQAMITRSGCLTLNDTPKP